jgi:hypothetical protein
VGMSDEVHRDLTHASTFSLKRWLRRISGRKPPRLIDALESLAIVNAKLLFCPFSTGRHDQWGWCSVVVELAEEAGLLATPW